METSPTYSQFYRASLPIRAASVSAMKLYSENEDEAQLMIQVMKIWRDPEKLEKSFADDLLQLR